MPNVVKTKTEREGNRAHSQPTINLRKAYGQQKGMKVRHTFGKRDEKYDKDSQWSKSHGSGENEREKECVRKRSKVMQYKAFNARNPYIHIPLYIHEIPLLLIVVL